MSKFEVVRPREKTIMRSIRLRESLDEAIDEIARETGESKSYVIDSLIEAGLRLHRGELKVTEA